MTLTFESEAEYLFWTAHEEIKAPELKGLVPQHCVRGYFIDFALPALRIGVEVDGYAYHSDKATFVRDRARGRHLALDGWMLIHFAGQEVYNAPHKCVQESANIVGRALERLNHSDPDTSFETTVESSLGDSFTGILEELADQREAVMITTLKPLRSKPHPKRGLIPGFLIRLIVLTGRHTNLVRDELPVYKQGFTELIKKAGVGATFVARLGRYGRYNAIRLNSDLDGDVELAQAALKKYGDPFEQGQNGGTT